MRPPPSLPPSASPVSLQAMPRHATIELEIPPYLVGRRAAGGRYVFHFQVPKRHRPEGWPGARRLPLDPAQRTGKGDHAEWTAAIADATRLYQRLTQEREPTPAPGEPPGTIPWLIAGITAPAAPKWRELSNASRINYLSDFRTLKAWSVELRHPHIRDIGRARISELLRRFGGKPFKQRHLKAALAYLFREAIQAECVDASPIDRNLTLTRAPRSEPQPWTEDDVDAAVAAARAAGRLSIAKALRLKWWSGMRNNDMLALMCPDHVFQRDGIWLVDRNTSKNGRPVIFRLHADVAAIHEEEIALARAAGIEAARRPFLINERTGKAWNMRVWQLALAEILETCGRGHLKPGWLRHTVMTEMDEARVSDAAGAALVGHSPSAHVRLKERHYRIRTEALADQAVVGLEAHRVSRRNKERKSDGKV